MILISCFSQITGTIRQMVEVKDGCWASDFRSFNVQSDNESLRRARFNISPVLSPSVMFVHLFLLQYRAHDVVIRKPERQGTTPIQLVMLL
jgi:hypothetical protein